MSVPCEPGLLCCAVQKMFESAIGAAGSPQASFFVKTGMASAIWTWIEMRFTTGFAHMTHRKLLCRREPLPPLTGVGLLIVGHRYHARAMNTAMTKRAKNICISRRPLCLSGHRRKRLLLKIQLYAVPLQCGAAIHQTSFHNVAIGKINGE